MAQSEVLDEARETSTSMTGTRKPGQSAQAELGQGVFPWCKVFENDCARKPWKSFWHILLWMALPSPFLSYVLPLLFASVTFCLATSPNPPPSPSTFFCPSRLSLSISYWCLTQGSSFCAQGAFQLHECRPAERQRTQHNEIPKWSSKSLEAALRTSSGSEVAKPWGLLSCLCDWVWNSFVLHFDFAKQGVWHSGQSWYLWFDAIWDAQRYWLTVIFKESLDIEVLHSAGFQQTERGLWHPGVGTCPSLFVGSCWSAHVPQELKGKGHIWGSPSLPSPYLVWCGHGVFLVRWALLSRAAAWETQSQQFRLERGREWQRQCYSLTKSKGTRLLGASQPNKSNKHYDSLLQCYWSNIFDGVSGTPWLCWEAQALGLSCKLQGVMSFTNSNWDSKVIVLCGLQAHSEPGGLRTCKMIKLGRLGNVKFW